ncbi:MAG: hypothetical protein ACPKNR_04365 [Pleomorphochaeta sp.]
MENNNSNYGNKTIKLGAIKFFLFIVVIEIGYLCFMMYQEYFDKNISTRTLIVNIGDINDDIEFSDSTQIENALSTGGMIIISLDSDWLDKNFNKYYSIYGANDSEGMFYVMGGVINYISSNGWLLVQAPSSGLNNSYYFTKNIKQNYDLSDILSDF